MFRDLQQQGYRGSYPTLARYTHRLRQAQEAAVPQPLSPQRALPPVRDRPKRPLTPRSAAWLLLRRPDHRDAEDTERLSRLRTQHPALAEATDLANDFIDLVRRQQPECLDPWLRRAQSCPLPAFRGFAKGLCTDDEAVRAAVTLPWSTGQVEGQINRLKVIQRQMYGCANLDLLNRRFQLAA